MKILNINKIKKNSLVFDTPGDYLVLFINLSETLKFEITTSRVNLEIVGIFWGKDQEDYKLTVFQRHQAAGSRSDLLIKGVFAGQSKLNYQGLIRIEKTAQKSIAFQKNQNLILSDQSTVVSHPDLEILADDVQCGHASTTSYLDENQLLYLQLRGLDRKTAISCLADGFINEAVAKIQTYDSNFQLKQPYD